MIFTRKHGRRKDFFLVGEIVDFTVVAKNIFPGGKTFEISRFPLETKKTLFC